MTPNPLCRRCSKGASALDAAALPMPVRAMAKMSARTLSVLLALAAQCVEIGNGRIVMSRARMRELGFGYPTRIDSARRELFRAGLLAIHKRGVRGARHLYRLTWLPLSKGSA